MRRSIWVMTPLIALAISAYVLFGPLATTVGESFGAARGEIPSSLLASQARRIIAIVAIPVLLAMLPLFGTRSIHRRLIGVVSLVLLAVFCLVSGMSIGMFYLPVVVVLAITLIAESNVATHPHRTIP